MLDTPDLEILNARDVANILKITERHARNIMAEMPHIRMGKLIRVRRSALDDFLQAKTVGLVGNGNGKNGNGAGDIAPHNSPPVVELPHASDYSIPDKQVEP